MKEYGGCIPLELNIGQEFDYHGFDVVALNSGRSAISYAAVSGGFKMAYIPYYTCKSVESSILKHGIEVRYYNIDEHFMPENVPNPEDVEVDKKERSFTEYATEEGSEVFKKIKEEYSDNSPKKALFVYTNYFGIMTKEMQQQILSKYENVLFDNTQGFFTEPVHGAYNAYSCRKFIGGDAGSGGYGGNGGNAGSGGSGGLGGPGGDGGDAGTTRQDESYFFSIDSVSAGVASITVKYSVYDPTNKIGRIVCQIAKDNSEVYTTYLLNKYDGSYTIHGLDYNTSYKLILSYYEYTIGLNNKYVLKEPAITKGKYYASTKKAYATVKTESMNRDTNNIVNKGSVGLYLKNLNLNLGDINDASASKARFTIYIRKDDGNIEKQYHTVAINNSAFHDYGQTVVINTDKNVAAIELNTIEAYTDYVSDSGDGSYKPITIYVNSETNGYYQSVN